VRAGMRVIQTIGIPTIAPTQEVDAIVVALKSRTIEPEVAVKQSLAALHWLKGLGAEQIYFKYCSTFDSTAKGNIGPVIDALIEALDANFTIATPAFPETGRTVFQGHLFVGDVLLSESGMKDHPLTPMRDSNLVRVLQGQSRHPVGLINHTIIAQGTSAIVNRIKQLRAGGVRLAIADATSNADLIRLGAALKDNPLVTGGSGLAIGLPANFGVYASDQASRLPAATGGQAIVSGSCSTMTNRQVAAFIASGRPAFAIDPLTITLGKDVVAECLAWTKSHIADGPVLVYSTAEPSAVKRVQSSLGSEHAGAAIERILALITKGLIQQGVGQLIVAGGETSGSCVQSLSIHQMQIGPQIAPGVPWCHAMTSEGAIHLALKSGNFGDEDFFQSAFERLTSVKDAL
jgi:3-dehydrotetronate 4-kinase